MKYNLDGISGEADCGANARAVKGRTRAGPALVAGCALQARTVVHIRWGKMRREESKDQVQSFENSGGRGVGAECRRKESGVW